MRSNIARMRWRACDSVADRIPGLAQHFLRRDALRLVLLDPVGDDRLQRLADSLLLGCRKLVHLGLAAYALDALRRAREIHLGRLERQRSPGELVDRGTAGRREAVVLLLVQRDQERRASEQRP